MRQGKKPTLINKVPAGEEPEKIDGYNYGGKLACPHCFGVDFRDAPMGPTCVKCEKVSQVEDLITLEQGRN